MSIKIPKAAAQFIEEATAHDFTVQTSHGDTFFEVYVEKPGFEEGRTVSASVSWSVKNVAPNNSRLGFATSYTPGVRFDYASTHFYGYDPTRGSRVWQHGAPKSLRQVKIQIGIPV